MSGKWSMETFWDIVQLTAMGLGVLAIIVLPFVWPVMKFFGYGKVGGLEHARPNYPTIGRRVVLSYGYKKIIIAGYKIIPAILRTGREQKRITWATPVAHIKGVCSTVSMHKVNPLTKQPLGGSNYNKELCDTPAVTVNVANDKRLIGKTVTLRVYYQKFVKGQYYTYPNLERNLYFDDKIEIYTKAVSDAGIKRSDWYFFFRSCSFIGTAVLAILGFGWLNSKT